MVQTTKQEVKLLQKENQRLIQVVADQAASMHKYKVDAQAQIQFLVEVINRIRVCRPLPAYSEASSTAAPAHAEAERTQARHYTSHK